MLQIQQLTAAVYQLEAERERVQTHCEHLISENHRLSNQIMSQSDPDYSTSVSTGRVTQQQYETLQHALNSLQVECVPYALLTYGLLVP